MSSLASLIWLRTIEIYKESPRYRPGFVDQILWDECARRAREELDEC